MRALAALIASIWLPAGGTFSSVQPAGSFLYLSGSAETGTGCIVSTVSLRAFRVTTTRVGRCVDPLHRISEHVVTDRHSPWQPVVLSNGSVVFRYEDASDTRPETAYGPGALWIYDVWTRDGAQIVRVSLESGRIVQRVRMPKMFRPLMAADADGVWLASSTNGGVSPGGPQPVLHVAPGATRATVVHRGGRAAMWLVAHGHTVWMQQVAGRSTFSLWRFDGVAGRPRVLATPRFFAVAAVWGGGSIWAAGADPKCTHERVVRVDPATGAETQIADPVTYSCEPLGFMPAGLAYAHGAVWFLDAPKLVRVRPE